MGCFLFKLVTCANALIVVLGKVGSFSENLQSGTLNMLGVMLTSIVIHGPSAEWVDVSG